MTRMTDSAVDVADANWQPVSPRLKTARALTLIVFFLPLAVITGVAGVFLSPWWWVGTGVVIGVGLWILWVIFRQVKALGYAELAEELVVRRGVMFKRLILVPYGRMQYVEVDSGPLARRLGIATVTLHTAAVAKAHIPGLPEAEARRLRDRLTRRSDAMMAGL